MNNKYIVVIGAVNADITGKAFDEIINNESNIGQINISPGGVGTNIARNLANLSLNTYLISVLSKDFLGPILLKEIENKHLSLEHAYFSETLSSDKYLSVLQNDGSLFCAINETKAIESLSLSHLEEKRRILENAACIIFDCNLKEDTIRYLTRNYSHKKLIAEAVSSAKVTKLKPFLKDIYLVKMNTNEFESLYGYKFTDSRAIEMSLRDENIIVVTAGPKGSFAYVKEKEYFQKAYTIDKIISVNGAGDAFLAGLVYGILREYDIKYCLKLGAKMSYNTLLAQESVNKEIDLDKFDWEY